MRRLVIRAACVATFCCAAPALAQPAQVGVEQYRRAEAMQPHNIAPLILDASIEPVWLPDGDGFWYRRQLAGGRARYVAVDPRTARASEAFDHQTLAAAIAKTGGKADPERLNLEQLKVSASGRIAFVTDGRSYDCGLAPVACRGSALEPAAPLEIASPDHRQSVFVRDNDLWLRDASGQERRLTRDGDPHFSYGKMPDNALLKVLTSTTGLKLAPFGVEWSPDGKRLVVTRVDERSLPDYEFLQTLPYDGGRRPKAVQVRTRLSGEPDTSSTEVSIIDVASGAQRRLETGKEGLSTVHFWDPDGSRFLALQGGDYSRKETLFEVDAATGAMRPVLTETSKTMLQVSPLEYDEAAIRFLPRTDEVVWYSQRDGWGHLYLVDLKTGRIKRQITKGAFAVQNILRLDEKARRIWFTAAGREAGEDPYFRHLYVAGLDGGDVRLLTPGDADHGFPGRGNPLIEAPLAALGFHPRWPQMISPSGRYLIDAASKPGEPTRYSLRRADGSEVGAFGAADVSAAVAAGWVMPELFKARAADGKTEIWGVVIKPANFDPTKRYPVIEEIYNGPQVVSTAHDFAKTVGGLGSLAQLESFAQLGFVGVMLDGRGTPMRSKAFQDYMFNNMQEFGVEDHVAAIQQIAAARPWMDTDRLGVYGHSFGGFSSMKAMLGYPDFYKAGASSAGPYDMYSMYPLDGFFEPPVFKDGAEEPTGPADHPRNWGKVDLTEQAGRLKGDLLLAYGDVDENAYPAATVRMIQALNAANKSYELIMFPNGTHAFARDPYFIRRRWDFFVRHLQQVEPPKDYAFAAH
jgi:dipeptidyl aminopeptidase/acylaminoacyl peptidase